MATHAVTGTFSATATLAGSPSGIKKGKPVGTESSPVTFSAVATLSLNTSQIQFKRNIIHTFDVNLANLDINVDEQHLLITRSQVWWDKSYTYRRILQIQPNSEGFEIDHPLYTILGKDMIRQQKIRSDVADIEVLRLISFVPETWEIVPKKVEVLDTTIKVSWPNQVVIAPDTITKDLYYIYYGNPSLANMPVQLDYEPAQWPVSLAYNSGELTYTRPGEHWEDGISQENGAKATLEFYGSKVRIVADISPEWGIAEVQIDDEEWEQVDFYNPVALESQVVYTKEGLSSLANHYIRIRQSGFKFASATDYKINIKAIEYLRHNLVVNVMEEADETLMWGSVIGGVVGK